MEALHGIAGVEAVHQMRRGLEGSGADPIRIGAGAPEEPRQPAATALRQRLSKALLAAGAFVAVDRGAEPADGAESLRGC